MELFLQHAARDGGDSKRVLLGSTASGALFALNAAGRLWTADGQLLALGTTPSFLAMCYHIRLPASLETAPLRFHSVVAHPSGQYVLISATHDHADGALAVLLLINTHALLPVGGDAARTRVVTGDADASAMLIEERCCTAQAVDPHRYRRLPALEVLRVHWHPRSRAHFGVLTSDNQLALFSVQRPAAAEQRFALQAGRGSAFGLVNSARAGLRAADFAFGVGGGWSHFAVFFLTRQGEIFYLCPVVPFGMRIPMLLVRQSLRPDDRTPAPVLRWLQEATATPDLGAPLERLRQLQLWRDTTNTVDVVPHALPGVTLALQGPIAAPSAAGSNFSRLVLLAAHPRPHEHAAPQSAATAAVALAARAEGGVAGVAWVHPIVAEVAPMFAPGQADVCRSDGGAIASVSHAIETVTPPQDPPPEPWAELHLQLPPSASASPRQGPTRPFAAASSATAPEALISFGGSFWKLCVPALAQVAAGGGRDGTGAAPRLSPPVCTPVTLPLANTRSTAVYEAVEATCFDAPLSGPVLALARPDGSGATLALAERPATAAAAAAALTIPEALLDGRATRADVLRDSAGPLGSAYGRAPPTVDAAKLARAAHAAGDPLAALQRAVEELNGGLVSFCALAYTGLVYRFQAVAREVGDGSVEAGEAAAVNARLAALRDGNAALRKRLVKACVVQNALNERAGLQCALLLTNLDEPRPLNAAELGLADECREWEHEAAFSAADCAQLCAQVEALSAAAAGDGEGGGVADGGLGAELSACGALLRDVRQRVSDAERAQVH